MRDPTTPEALEVLRHQHGLIARDQARRAHLGDHEIKYLLASGRWQRIGPGVYGIGGHRQSWHRELWAALLHAGPGSVVSHESAARLHGFEQARAGLVELSVPRGRRHAPPGVRWRRVDDLVPADVTEVGGLPLTTAARCAVDVASSMSITRLRLLVEAGVIERRFTLEEVGAALGRVRRRGKPGVRALASVLDDLGPGAGIPRSELERLLDAAIRLAGLPRPVHEHPLPGGGPVSGFVDRYWPEARLVAEADGRRWHARRQQMVRDNERTLQAQARGHQTVRFMWEQLRHDPRGSAELLRAVYEERRRSIS